jgi:ribosomal protein S18 acetylase RimI-like enzyme
MHPLDKPVWTALTTHQAPIALVEGMARRFPPEMAVFGALALPMPPAWASLARLSPAPVGLLSSAPLQLPAGWSVTRHVELFQMVLEVADAEAAAGERSSASSSPGSGNAGPETLELKEADMAEMSLLYEATRPGRKICPRIQKLGTFLGIRSEGKLVAMGGLRMHLPGYREITTVATMPGHEGRGYATALVAALVDRIRERGERPFLTVRTDNERAVAIYHRLGFRERARLHSTTVTCSAG